MREIKFRGYAVEELIGTQWLTDGFGVSKIEYTDGTSSTWLSTPFGDYKVFEESVGQYTGLKDKNGVEIYEGDITKESRKRVKNERHFVVVWNNDIGSYTFKPLDKIETSYPCFNVGTIKSLEVVGNIYENPDLSQEDKHEER